MPLQHNHAHILDHAVHGIDEEQPLHLCGIRFHRIEDGGHVHQKHREHVVEVLNIAEKNVQRRQNHADAQVHDRQTRDGIHDGQHAPPEGHLIDGREHKEHHQRNAEIDDGRHVFGQQEQVFRHIDFAEYRGVAHQGVHAARGCLPIIAEKQVAGEQVGGIMLHGSAKKPGEHQPHHQ